MVVMSCQETVWKESAIQSEKEKTYRKTKPKDQGKFFINIKNYFTIPCDFNTFPNQCRLYRNAWYYISINFVKFGLIFYQSVQFNAIPKSVQFMQECSGLYMKRIKIFFHKNSPNRDILSNSQIRALNAIPKSVQFMQECSGLYMKRIKIFFTKIHQTVTFY